LPGGSRGLGDVYKRQAFRRVDAQVFDAATPVLNITTVLGRY
jgi:hypothetical protein